MKSTELKKTTASLQLMQKLKKIGKTCIVQLTNLYRVSRWIKGSLIVAYDAFIIDYRDQKNDWHYYQEKTTIEPVETPESK